MFDIVPVQSDAPYGVCHGDETYLQFFPYYMDYIPDDGLNAADLRVSNNFLELWKNFIKTGGSSTEGI